MAKPPTKLEDPERYQKVLTNCANSSIMQEDEIGAHPVAMVPRLFRRCMVIKVVNYDASAWRLVGRGAYATAYNGDNIRVIYTKTGNRRLYDSYWMVQVKGNDKMWHGIRVKNPVSSLSVHRYEVDSTRDGAIKRFEDHLVDGCLIG